MLYLGVYLVEVLGWQVHKTIFSYLLFDQVKSGISVNGKKALAVVVEGIL